MRWDNNWWTWRKWLCWLWGWCCWWRSYQEWRWKAAPQPPSDRRPVLAPVPTFKPNTNITDSNYHHLSQHFHSHHSRCDDHDDDHYFSTAFWIFIDIRASTFNSLSLWWSKWRPEERVRWGLSSRRGLSHRPTFAIIIVVGMMMVSTTINGGL